MIWCTIGAEPYICHTHPKKTHQKVFLKVRALGDASSKKIKNKEERESEAAQILIGKKLLEFSNNLLPLHSSLLFLFLFFFNLSFFTFSFLFSLYSLLLVAYLSSLFFLFFLFLCFFNWLESKIIFNFN